MEYNPHEQFISIDARKSFSSTSASIAEKRFKTLGYEDDRKDFVQVMASLMDPTGGLLTGSADEFIPSIASTIIKGFSSGL